MCVWRHLQRCNLAEEGKLTINGLRFWSENGKGSTSMYLSLSTYFGGSVTKVVLCLLQWTLSLQTMSQNKSPLKFLYQVFCHSVIKVTSILLNFKTPSIKELIHVTNLALFHTLIFNHIWLHVTFKSIVRIYYCVYPCMCSNIGWYFCMDTCASDACMCRS